MPLRCYPRAILTGLIGALSVPLPLAYAASLPPPLLDIPRLCDRIAHGNATAMSECVVQESEARADVLQRWQLFSNADAQRCIKVSSEARRYPDTAMVKCFQNPAPMAPATQVKTKRKLKAAAAPR